MEINTQSKPTAHHRTGGGFRNPWPASQRPGIRSLVRWWFESLKSAPRQPDGPPPQLVKSRHADPRCPPDELRITAIGHSTFLLQLGELNILTDPVWGQRCSPVSFLGPRRRHAPGIPFEALPPIDCVLLSHDHYDHLDNYTVRCLARSHPQAHWFVPLGVGARLRKRGVKLVTERDWWETARFYSTEFTCLPAAHFSGRSFHDRDKTLWCGWGLKSNGRCVCFLGDTGLHEDFGTIGERVGPCDLVLVPVGAYAPRWFMRPIHMDPAEALDAFAALTALNPSHPTVMLAMHWGTFILSDEPADEPPRHIRELWTTAARPENLLWLLAPGETRSLPPRK